MKILCFILSLIVFSLSAVPCCAEDNCNYEIKTEQTDNHTDDHQESDCTTCSPFLTCGTCSGFIYTRFELNFKEVDFIKDEFVICKSQISDNFFDNIWQPPKISL